tara:strand:- start:8448 stop:9464 length:1017 start_codon:yes stop_codon:yes gene_type:complete
MTQANKLHVIIPQEQLIKMAGQDCFNLGVALSQSTSPTNLQVSEHKVSADISEHHVVLNYPDKHIQGACSCPRSDGFDFCEHCVCLCLHINKQNQQIRSLAKGPDKSKVLAYLLSLDKQVLAKQCLNLITEDADEFERYRLKAFLHQGEIDYSQLKAQITALTRKPDNLFSQRKVKVFFSKLERFLAELNADDAPDFDADKLQKVLEYAFQRINALLEHIDDSTEQRQGCLSHLHQLYADLLEQNQSRDDTQAKRLFSFWLNDRFNLLGIQAANWLNTKAKEKFKTLAHTKWENNSSNNQTTLTTWQKVKLARYLFEEAIQSHDNLRANEYRRFFSKD